jgi:hypothetical protein
LNTALRKKLEKKLKKKWRTKPWHKTHQKSDI